MTDVAAAPEEGALGGLAGLMAKLSGTLGDEPGLGRGLPLGDRTLGVGLAVLASAAAAAVICTVLPMPVSASKTPPGQPVERAAAPAARPASPMAAGFDVVKAWAAEHASLYATNSPAIRGARHDAWVPMGGLSILMATRYPSAGGADTSTQATGDEKTVPMPLPAPVARVNGSARGAVARTRPVNIEPKVASLPPQQPEPGYFGFFRKLFQGPDHAAKVMLAANPKTAVYDIEKRAVYLPDGDKLEAHSGYGKWMDDPDSFERKNLGVTPPNIYAVSFRQKLFHGVRALRLTPVGEGKMYGRDGILAHSYLLGEGGQSNGCVSVKDYDKFLQAYKDGEFERIIVVRSADTAAPSQVASVAPGSS